MWRLLSSGADPMRKLQLATIIELTPAMPPRAPTAQPDYVRARDLPKLVPLWPSEYANLSRAGHARLLAKLRRALRAERQKGIGGHWSYDLTRHAQLLRAYRAEAMAYVRAGMPPFPGDMPE
jgi:hypothetical protein